MRTMILLDRNWLFHEGDLSDEIPSVKGPIYSSSKTERMLWGPAARNFNDNCDQYWAKSEVHTERWEKVNLPHDYIIRQEPKRENNNALGFFEYRNAWYRKHLTFNDNYRNRRVTLLFDGVATHATVYFNGSLLKHNFCGYTSFEVDLTPYIRFGEDNVISVYVDAKHYEGWWYNGGGIYRHVWLISTYPVAVDLWGVHVDPEKISEHDWNVKLTTTVRNAAVDINTVTVFNRLIDPDGKTIAETSATSSVPPFETSDLFCQTAVSDPILWDVDNPTLYTCVTTVSVGGNTVCEPMEWNVPYAAGVLEAKGYCDGKLAATDKIETTGHPYRLKLLLETQNLIAGHGDIAFVTCYCVDNQGREVPDASPMVHFDTNAAGRIVGTGSYVCDHTPVPSPDRKMYAGKISVAISVGNMAGELTLYAYADELGEAKLVIPISQEQL